MVVFVLRRSRASERWWKIVVGVWVRMRGCKRWREGCGDGRR